MGQSLSNFFRFFSLNFEKLKLKKLITTCYKNNDADLFSTHTCEKGKYLVYEGDKDGDRIPGPDETTIRDFKGDGDFRSKECISLLQEADIVVTNPPFSLFREYLQQLIEHDKKFLIIGNQNAISYKEVFGLIKEDKMWLGYTHPVAFVVPDHYEMREGRSWRDEKGTNWRSLGNACWFTNLDIQKRHESLVLYKTYSPESYPTYVNYDAIEVSRYTDIPNDYDGAMGVPVTFLDKYSPDQFEILGSSMTLSNPMSGFAEKGTYEQGGPRFYLANGNGTYRRMYDRLVIRNKRLG